MQLRIIHKPCAPRVDPAVDVSVLSDVDKLSLPLPQFPSVRDRSLRTPYAGRDDDLSWLRDSNTIWNEFTLFIYFVFYTCIVPM